MFVFLMLSSPGDINVNYQAFIPYCGGVRACVHVCMRACVCVCVCVCVVGRGQSRWCNHPNIYHDPAISYSISLVCLCWRMQWGSGYMCWYKCEVNNNETLAQLLNKI